MHRRLFRILFDASADGGSGGSGDGDGSGSGGDRPLAGAALKSALDKERKARKELETRLAAIESAAETERKRLEDASKSDLDKLTAQVAALTTERDQERSAREIAEHEQARVERVRRHAGEFADADDVVALLRGKGILDSIEDDDVAQRVLAELKRDKPHLLRQATTPTGLEQILQNGQPAPPAPPAGGPQQQQGNAPTDYISTEKLVEMSPEQLKQLQRDNPALYRKSIEMFASGQETYRTVPVHR